jgi:hypothetical protein
VEPEKESAQHRKIPRCNASAPAHGFYWHRDFLKRRLIRADTNRVGSENAAESKRFGRLKSNDRQRKV